MFQLAEIQAVVQETLAASAPGPASMTWPAFGLGAAALGAGLTALVMLAGICVVIKFLLQSNVIVPKKGTRQQPKQAARETDASEIEPSWVAVTRSSSEVRDPSAPLHHLRGNLSDADMAQLAEGAPLGVGRAKRFRAALAQRFSIRGAIEKIRERRRYRWVTAEAKHGDGLLSIYADSRKTEHKGRGPGGPSPTGRDKVRRMLDKRFNMDEDADILRSLRRTEIFSWLPDHILRALANSADRVTLEAGQTLYKAEQQIASPCYYVIIRGRVSIVLPASPSAPVGDDNKRGQPDSQQPRLFDEPKLAHPAPRPAVAGPMRKSVAQADAVSLATESTSANAQVRSDHQAVAFGPDESVTGLADLLAAITSQPVESVASAIAEEETVLVKIDHASCLAAVFAKFPGFREELLLRVLIRLNRVTLMSVFRLTGRIVITDTRRELAGAGVARLRAARPVRHEAKNVAELAVAYLSAELGLSSDELAKCTRLSKWCSTKGAPLQPPGAAANAVPKPASCHSGELDGWDDLQDESDYLSEGDSSDFGGDESSMDLQPSSPGSLPGSGLSHALRPRRRPVAHSSATAVVQILRLPRGESLIKTCDEPALYVVLCGQLELLAGRREDSTASRIEHVYEPGHAFGQLSLLTGAWNDWYVGRRSAQGASADAVWVRAGTTSEETVLARVSQRDYDALIDKFPKIILHKARSLALNLSGMTRMIDLTTQWRYVSAGDVVVHEGELLDTLYVVLHGRLQGTTDGSAAAAADASACAAAQPTGASGLAPPPGSPSFGAGSSSLLREYGRGAIIGEMAFLTEQCMDQTVTAMRTGQLAAIPKAAMLEVMRVYPQVVFHIGRIMSAGMAKARLEAQGGPAATLRFGGRPTNTSVIAVVPASATAPVDHFLYTLSAALRSMGTTVEILNSDLVERMADERKLGVGNVLSAPFSALEQMILLNWLSEAEDTNDIVFYQVDPWADPEPSWWSKMCVEQADLVLLVGNAADGPKVTALERKLDAINTNARKELVLVHLMRDEPGADAELPRNTRDWIVNRGNIHHHHHIRFHPDREALFRGSGSWDVEHYRSDFRRLARWLIGEPVGIVLGGGGARGLAHVAVLRTLEEAGIPVDFIAGTSIGAYVGALYAMKNDTLLMHKKLQEFVVEMSSTWRKLSDLTLPVTSYFSGSNFNRGIVRSFGNTKIEDLWIPYFCMTTDLTDSVEIAHRNGSLWRYVRASMTLVNFIPPLCDVVEEEIPEGELDDGIDSSVVGAAAASLAATEAAEKAAFASLATAQAADLDGATDDEAASPNEVSEHRAAPSRPSGAAGLADEELANKPRKTRKTVHYLADGGYMNNLPADLMRNFLGPKATIIAVDVQGEWKFAGHDYGDSFSGWKYLLQWLNPFQETPNVPTSADIQTQLAYIASVKQGSTAPQTTMPGTAGSVYTKGYGGIAALPNKDLRQDIDLYLTPPVGDITTLEFHRSAEIQERSYVWAREKLSVWLDQLRNTDVARLRSLVWRPQRLRSSDSTVEEPARSSERESDLLASKLCTRRREEPRSNPMLHRRTRSWAKLSPY